MTLPHVGSPQNLYESSWNYAQDCTLAIEAATGIVIDANPAAETLTGYSREELLGINVVLLHPEKERERVQVEFQDPAAHPLPPTGFHIQSKDGRSVPVAIWSTQPLDLAGRRVVIAEFRDIAKSLEHEHRLATKRWALSAYAAAAVALWQKHTPESLFEAVCEAIAREPIYVFAWVGIAEDGPGKPIRVAGQAGSGVGILDGIQMSWSEDAPGGMGPTPNCIRSGQLQILADTQNLTMRSPWTDRFSQFGIQSSVSIPFQSNGSTRGALVVCAARPNAFESVAIEVFQHLAEQIGFGIHAIEQEQYLKAEREHVARTEQQLTKALSAMVAPIVTAMEMRDPYTVGHQSRVAEIAAAIGREMGWPEERLQGLRVAAQVHDIGKISIPAEILTKPGELNEAERLMINQHAEIGYTILKDIPFPWPIAEIVRQHHEKIDGSGYPRGLKDDQILPEARILTVADIVEAMASYRPYRTGLKLHLVLREIEKEAGTQLDADAVRICASLFRDKHFVVPGWIRR